MGELEFRTLNDILTVNAARYPERPALVSEDDTISYAALAERVMALAGGVTSLGIGKGDKVALLLTNCPEFIEAVFALARIGAVFVPINPALTVSEVSYIVDHSEARALLIDAPGIATAGSVSEQCRGLRTLISTQEPGPGMRSLPELRSTTTPRCDVAVSGDDQASLMYTSGTTGLPKGVLQAHRAYAYGPVARARRVGWGPADRVMLITQLFHIQGLAYVTLACLAVGGAVVLRPRFSASTFWDDVRRFNVTGTSAPRTLSHILMNRPPTPQDADNPLEVWVGGLPPGLWEQFEDRFGVTLVSSYGQTEDLSTIVNYRDRARRKIGPGILGLPVGDERHQVKIVDDEGKEVPRNQVGEIAKRSPGVMLGYYKAPEATAAAFRDGWLLSGDYGRMDEDGFIYFVDRKKDIIKRSGENISAAEIERVLSSHPSIAEGVAIGVFDPIRQEEVKVFVRLVDGVTEQDLPPAAIFDYLASRLAAFKVPRFLEYATDFPRTATMKVQKEVLKQQVPRTVYERLPDGRVTLARQ